MFQIHVYECGDTEVCKINTKPDPFINTDVIEDTFEKAVATLIEYGHEEDRINDALGEAIKNPLDWYKV